MPNTGLVFPNGPIDLGNGKRSWFDMSGVLNASNHQEALANSILAVNFNAERINAYINARKWNLGVSPRRTVLAGFSQGGTAAFRSAVLRSDALAGLCVISGATVGMAMPEGAPRFPVLAVVGEFEDKPYSGRPFFPGRVKELERQGFDVTSHIEPDVGHGRVVTPRVVRRLSEFSRDITPSAVPKTKHNHQPASSVGHERALAM